MNDLENFKIIDIDKIARKGMKREGLFFNLESVYDKDTMKWILIKFLKESLEFLSESEEARKIQRGKLVERWIDENLPKLSGNYDHSPIY